MGEASEKEFFDDGEADGNSLHESTSDDQAHNQISITQHADGDLDHTVQVAGMAEQQQQRGGDESMTQETLAEVVGDEGGDTITERELGPVEQEQPMDKINYPGHDPATTQLPEGEHSLEVIGERSNSNPLDYGISDISTKDAKEEPGSGMKSLPREESSPSTLALSDLHTPSKTGSRMENRGSRAQPLNIPEHAPNRVDFVHHEPEPDEYRKVHIVKQTQNTDAIDIDMDQTDDATHVPGNRNAFDKTLDTTTHELSEDHLGEKEPPNEELEQHGADFGNHESEAMASGLQGNNLQLGTADEPLPEQFEDSARSEEVQEASLVSHHAGEEMSKTQDTPGEYATSESENEEEIDEDEEEHETDNHTSKAALNGQGLWSQRPQLFGEDQHFTNPSPTPPYPRPRVSAQFKRDMDYEQYETSRHASQNLPGVEDPHNLDLRVDHRHQQQMQIERQRRQMAQDLYSRQQPGLKVPVSLDQSRPNMPPTPMAPLDYRSAARGGYQYADFTPYPMNLQDLGNLSSAYAPMPPHPARRPFPSHGYSMANQPSIPLMPDEWQFGPRSGSVRPTIARPIAYAQNHNEGGGISDDDEPLKTRVKRHPSVLSQNSVLSDSSQVRKSKHMRQGSGQDYGSEVEVLAVKSKPKLITTQNPVRMHRPLPQSTQVPADVPSSPSSGKEIGSWKLPEFEVQRQPVEKKDDLPSVKVSLPNMVREELLLSADHSEQEVHLLLNVFLPGQQALDNPDPAPATALLNFHTIVLMVVEAFVQYEIGDEFGLGRGHFHQNHDQNDEEYERMRDAKEANVDEIFFAVIDRWRAGLESRKQPVLLIRGAQEFCDVALDVIYYIKEHGLLKPEPVARRVRADKGTKRGPKKGKEEDATDTGKGKGKGKVEAGEESKATRGVKRPVAPKVNTLQPRKKVKAETTTKRKTKSKMPAITVIKRRN